MKKNIAKPIAWTVVGAGILSLIVGTSVDWTHTPLIFASGSSSVQPLIQKLSNTFTEADVIANVGGSGMGISEIAHGLKDMGMASKMPSVSQIGVNKNIEDRFNQALSKGKINPTEISHSLYTEKDGQPNYYLKNNGEFTNLWGGETKNKTSQTKTITIAWDAIAIVYSRQGLPDNARLNINANNIADIFTAFSGYKQMDLVEVINKGTPNAIPNPTTKIPMKPFVRAGGANASGTADAFYKDSHLEPNMSGWTDKDKQDYKDITKKSLGGGTYGSFVQTTNESNSQAWNTMLGGNEKQRAGKIIYLSSGYVSQNLKEILDAGFDVATYDGHDLIAKDQNNNPFLDSSSIARNYGWYRPFNVMINIPKDGYPKEYLVKFINYLLRESQDGKNTKNQPLCENDPTADGKNTFLDEGYAPLDIQQIQTMMLPTNNDRTLSDIWNIPSSTSNAEKQKVFNEFLKEFYVSDFDLLTKVNLERFKSRIKSGVLYGANPHPVNKVIKLKKMETN